MPSFFRWTGGALAASLLVLYRISGVPSFLVGAIVAVLAGFAVVAVVAGFAVVTVVAGFVVAAVVAGFAVVAVTVLFPFGFFVPVACVVWAKLNPASPSNRLTISVIFFMFQWCFLVK